MINIAKKMLADGDCTLVVANNGVAKKYSRRGVADLVELYTTEPEFLHRAAVADKIIGRAAAALMIKGGVSEVYTNTITNDALTMLTAASIPVKYKSLTTMVENRTNTGRCPLDSLCSNFIDIDDMVFAIISFTRRMSMK